jgi:signal transduction histidine kinase/DNA-binding response OmpR family regulator
MVSKAKRILFILMCGLVARAGAQESTYKADSITIYSLGNQAFALRTSQPDSALLLADQALQLAEIIRDTQAQVSLWRIKGVVQYGQKRMDDAYRNFERSYQLAQKIHFREARLLINLGNVDFYRKDFAKALTRYQQALRLSEQQDTVEWMDALNNIGSVYSRSYRFQDAADTYRKSLALQRAFNNEKAQLPTLVNLGEAYRKLNQTDKETAAFEEGLQLATALNDSTWIAGFYTHIARAYSNRGFYPQSMEAWQRALSIHSDRGDSLAMAQTLHRIGVVHQDNDNYELAMDYYRQALVIYTQKRDFRSQANMLNSLGRSFLSQQQYQPALDHFHRAIRIYRQINNRTSISYPFFNLGDTYEQMGQLDSAALYLDRAYKIATVEHAYELESLALISLGKVAQQQGASEEAIRFYRKAINIARIESMRQEEMEATGQLYKALKDQNRMQEALMNLERHHELKDSLFNEESTRRIAQLEAQYAFEQEKKTIEDQNAAEKRKLDAEIRQQRNLQWILGIALVLTLFALFLLYRFLRFRKASELEQERLNNQINVQQLLYEQKERERLQEVDAFKSRFFANISHELRTPLTLILGPVDRLLKKGTLKQAEQTQLQLVQQNAGFLLKRVNEILDLTKFDARQMQLQESPTAYYDFCKRLAANFESFAQQKDQQFTFHYRLDKDLNILLDQTKFAHVFNNLLANAIKYTPASGNIAVSLYERESSGAARLVLEVKDNGIGIREKDLPHVLDRFYQADQGENKAGGSGIGLALSREVAQVMQGEIRVESSWGKGSTFYFEFPYREVMGVVPDTDAPEAGMPHVDLGVLLSPVQLKQERPGIMVVEDNKQLRDYLQLILSDHYEVTTAQHGAEALEKLSHWNGRLLIADVMMPKMDGFELLSKIKNSDRYRHLPVIMLTARSEMQDKLKALRIGVDDYLLKPFVEEELLSRIQNLLRNEKKRQASDSKNDPVAVPLSADISAADLQWLEHLEDRLRTEVGNPNFTFAQLETSLFISRSQLQRRLKKLTGLSPNKYFREIKLQVARELLESGSVRTVNEVANAVGFDTAKYFSKIYEKRYGRRPVEWL